MHSEFVLKMVTGLAATVLVLIHAQKLATQDQAQLVTPLQRLKMPFMLAIAFFFVSLILAQTSLLSLILDFDPSLPLWLVFLTARLLFLWIIAGRVLAWAQHSFHKTRYALLTIITIGSLAAEVVVIVPASYFVGPGKTDQNGVILQTIQVTCIPSALATVCRVYGDPVDELEATRKVKTLLLGSLVSHAISGCRRLGFSEAAYSKKSLQEILDENLPFIITISSGFYQIEHAIGVIGCRNGNLYLADPLRGLIIMTAAQLQKNWKIDIIRLGPRSDSRPLPALDAFSPELLTSSR